MTRSDLEKGRCKYNPRRTYGYFYSYCDSMSYCENCDKKVRFWCKIKRKIEDIQVKRILKICGYEEE